MLSKGIKESDILPEFVLSTNTFEDVQMAKPIVNKYGVKEITLITQDHHQRSMDAAEYVFPKEEYNLSYLWAMTALPNEEYRNLEKIEAEKRTKYVKAREKNEGISK